MYSTPLPATSSSLSPIALAIRSSLASLRSNPEMALEWLSCRAYRMRQAAEKREMQVMIPAEGECIVNSNWRFVLFSLSYSCSALISPRSQLRLECSLWL